MTAAARIAEAATAPLASEVFALRCEARAMLFVLGELSLHEAVDELQDAAEHKGLVIALGQDEVQRLMAEAFGAVRDDIGETEHYRDDGWSASGWREAAIKYHEDRGKRVLVVELNPERLAQLREIITDDVSLERAWREFNKPKCLAASTLEGAEYLVQTNDPKRFEGWLLQHSAPEREAIVQHIKRKRDQS